MNIARSSLKLFVGNVAASGIGFLGIAYFARELGPRIMGIFFLFQALLGMLSMPADLGLGGAVEKRISEGESQGSYLASVFALKTALAVIIGLTIIVLQGYINRYLGEPIAVYLAAAIILQEGAQLSVSVLRGELRPGETAVLQLARQATWVGISALLVNTGLEAEALVFGILSGLVVMFVLGWYKVSISLAPPSVRHARSLIDYGRYNAVSSIGGYFYNWMDVVILGYFLTQAHVGAYEAAWRITAITVLFSTSLATTLFPQISQWDAEDTKYRIEEVISEVITPSLLLVVPAFFGTLIFSKEILRFIFGPEFTIASTVLIILAGEKVLQAIHVVFGRVLQGLDKPDLAAKATIVSVILNLILNVILIPSIGLVGAAIATTVSFSANTLLHVYFLSDFIDLKIPYREVIYCAISSAIMAILLFGFRSIFTINSLPRLIVGISVGAIIYFSFILLYAPMRTKIISALYSDWI